MPPRVALIAAMEREIAPLAKRFTRRTDSQTGFSYFERPGVWLVCAGVGGDHAAAAARWLVASVKPEVVVSIGFAGALTPDCKAGDVITPATVIDGSTGDQFSLGTGSGVLVSNAGVLDEPGKRKLAEQYGAGAVDMEAASVARVAQQNGIPFFAVKAISDELGLAMPAMDRFVNGKGEFQTLKLLAYAAIRPALWPVLARLGRNAKVASARLCGWLENEMSRDFQDMSGAAALGKARL